jgi:hypothetical protein
MPARAFVAWRLVFSSMRARTTAVAAMIGTPVAAM